LAGTTNSTNSKLISKGSKTRTRASALSLKSIHQKKTIVTSTDKTEIDKTSLAKDLFTNDEFLKHWNKYAKTLANNGKKSQASILLASEPTLNKFTIQYTLPTNLMREQLNLIKPKLLEYLRKNLNNFSISLEINVKETAHKKFIYTAEEKYQKLKEMNPNIELLKNTFKLDL